LTYSGPDSATAAVKGSCTDIAGNVGKASFALKYDATKPTVTYNGNADTYTADQTMAITCTIACIVPPGSGQSPAEGVKQRWPDPRRCSSYRQCRC